MTEREQLEQAIEALENQRAILGDAVVELALAPLRRQLVEIERGECETVPALGGERKLVTVMFADISGFTALSERLDPEVVRELMNACFDHLVPLVARYGGTVDKFIGDEIMVLFGAPVAHENDPERSLSTALEMMDALATFNAQHDTDLGIHIGINTGLVIAGGIGSEGRQQYSVMGDAVNLAARLEGVSERGEIIVGPDTFRLAAPLFEFEPLEPIRLKGKAEPVLVYRLLALKVAPGKVRGVAGLASPLVGRQAEFRALGAAVEQLLDGAGGIATIVGEAGLGKSRLVAELRQSVTSERIYWVEGRCLSYGTSIAYLLWLDVLRGLLGVTAKDPPDLVRRTLQKQVQALCPTRFDDVYPYLAQLVVGASTEARPEIEGERLKTGTFCAVWSLIENMAWQQPLVLICEDLHWADPTSLELLDGLMALTDNVPLLLLCLSRPERGHGCWRIKETAARRHSHRHTDLWLTPLSAAESETLVGNLLRLEGLPEKLAERILGRAEGNPFYVEEILRSLIDDGAILRDAVTGGWLVTRGVVDIAIPDTLHGVLMARIDRLQDETKRVLQLSAVIGRFFLYRVLAAITREECELDGCLLALQQEDMVRERVGAPEQEYSFKHHLTQEAAYNSLLRKERRAFHRRVAEALEQLFPDRVEEQVGLLAYHWERAEEPDAKRAKIYLLRAGDQARLAYALEEATDYYQRALVLLKEGQDYERTARTLMKLGLTYHIAFDFQRARKAYEEGFVLWQWVGEQPISLPPVSQPLRVDWPYLPLSLDPALAADVDSTGVVDQLFSGLVALSPGLEVVPDVARGWQVSRGGQEYTFHLRDDVCWSDGVPVTAFDFEYAWKRVLDPITESPAASLLYSLKGGKAFHQGEAPDADRIGVRALDEVTLLVELERPTSYFLYLLACSTSYPVPRHAVEAHGVTWAGVGNLVTNGPFQLETWNQGELTLLRNPDYHGRFTGNVERVELYALQEGVDRLEAYAKGDLDLLFLWGLAEEREPVRQRYAGEYISAPLLGTTFVGFVSRPPFDDLCVRQAFACAIDKEGFAGIQMQGYVFPATGGLVPPCMPAHSAGIGLPYDPDRARRLLDGAGYPGGRGFPPVEFLIDPSNEPPAGYLVDQWKENLGVEIAYRVVEVDEFLARVADRPPHIFFGAWFADYPDPDNFMRVCEAVRWARWQDKSYLRLVERAVRVMDQGERMAMYGQAERALVEGAAVVPFTYARHHLLVKPWLRNYPVSPTRWWFWQDVVVEPH